MLENEFDLSTQQLKEICEAFAQKIDEGLKADGREIACLPTFLGLPDGQQSGSALVVDTGGTNMRAAVVELSPSEGDIRSGPIADKIPDGRDGVSVSGRDFFAAQAQLSSKLESDARELPLGYCFSYPARNQADGDAILLRWTKGLQIEGVIGEPVGVALRQSLKEVGFRTSQCSVLNDTVASLLGGVHLYGSGEYGQNYIGLILGTGTNMAGVFTPEQLSKVSAKDSMVVNLESGNFQPPHLSKYDDQFDASTDTPGKQRFEKAISGYYLPQLFQSIMPDHNLSQSSSALVELRDQGSGPESDLAKQLLRRSARLAAAGLAAVASFYPKERPTGVLAEGGLLWGDPQYVPTLKEALRELTGDDRLRLIEQSENVNLLGAASAALATEART